MATSLGLQQSVARPQHPLSSDFRQSCAVGQSLQACFPVSRSPSGHCSRRLHCRASDASFSADDSFQGPAKVFPRISVQDPYRRLGLSRDASTEEISDAKNYLIGEYQNHPRSCEAIEEAYDKIIQEKFRERRNTKINLKADLKKKVAESPPWFKAVLNMVDSPKRAVILQRAALFLCLAAWSILNPVEGGPALQVAIALGLTIYFINDRLKSIGKAFLLGFGSLILGWIVGSFIVPFIPELTFVGGYWSLELGTALISYVFLWFATTFLK